MEVIPPGCTHAEGKPYGYEVCTSYFRARVYATPEDLLYEMDRAIEKSLGTCLPRKHIVVCLKYSSIA